MYVLWGGYVSRWNFPKPGSEWSADIIISFVVVVVVVGWWEAAAGGVGGGGGAMSLRQAVRVSGKAQHATWNHGIEMIEVVNPQQQVPCL